MLVRNSLAVAALTLGSLAVLPAWGQVGRTPYNPNSNQNSATSQAGKQVADARLNIAKIEQQMTRIKTRVRAQLLSKPEFATANADFTRANTALETARKQALAALHNKPEYQRLVKEREEAQTKRDSANTGGQQVSDEELQKANDIVFKDGLALKKMETQTLADDAKYQEAKSKADAAKAKVDQVDSQVQEALKNDTDYQQLDQSLQQAKQTLDQARQSQAQAAQQERQQREQEAKSREQSHSGGSSGGRGH